LRAALVDTSAVVHEEAGALVATWAEVEARFARDGQGIWSSHLTGNVDEPRAVAIITAVDQAYGRRVQAAVLARLRDRAPQAGLRVESERIEDDASVVLVLTADGGVR
jgi:hypothetical protein